MIQYMIILIKGNALCLFNFYALSSIVSNHVAVSPLLLREPLSDCLKDVDLIPPFNRMLLEVTFGKLYSWAIQNVRNILLEASTRFKELGKWCEYMTCSFQSKLPLVLHNTC